MDAIWIIVAGIFCAWTILRVLGSERERRIRDLKIIMAAAAPAAAPEPAPSNPTKHPPAFGRPASPVRSKVAR
jgi:hypothetical protein